MKAIELLKSILDSTGLVEVDSYVLRMIKTKTGEESKPITTSNGLPFVLPRNEMLSSLLEEDENGKMVVTKVPFNCISEDILTGKSEAIDTLAKICQSQYNATVYEVGRALIELLRNDRVEKLSTELQGFIANASEYTNKNMKQLADKETFPKWKRVFDNIVTDRTDLYTTFIRRSNLNYNGEKYTRAVIVNYPLLREFEELEKEDNGTYNFVGVNLRPKDYSVFKVVFDFLFPKVEDYEYVVGSNHNNYPSFMSLYGAYLDLMTPLMKTARCLRSQMLSDDTTNRLEISLTRKELPKVLESVKKELDNIVPEKDLLTSCYNSKKKVVQEEETIQPVQLPVQKVEEAPVAKYQQPVQQLQPIQQPAYQQPAPQQQLDDADIFNSALGSRGGYYGGHVTAPVYVDNSQYRPNGQPSIKEAILRNYKVPSPFEQPPVNPYQSYNNYGGGFNSYQNGYNNNSYGQPSGYGYNPYPNWR